MSNFFSLIYYPAYLLTNGSAAPALEALEDPGRFATIKGSDAIDDRRLEPGGVK